MSHIAYIDPDEEIISVIGRLRKTQDTDVFFVIPKRAAFLQSLVNLRLLERESKKLGKHICMVTQDEAGRLLAEKAHIEVRSSLEGIESANSKSSPPAFSSPVKVARMDGAVAGNASQKNPLAPPHSEFVGSASFFNENSKMISRSQFENAPRKPVPVQPPVQEKPLPVSIPQSQVAPAPVAPSQTLPVRDRTPKRLLALNSLLSREKAEPISSVPPPDSSQSSPLPEVSPRSPSVLPSHFAQPALSPSGGGGASSRRFSGEGVNVSFSPHVTPAVLPKKLEETQKKDDSSQETPMVRFYQNKGKEGEKKPEKIFLSEEKSSRNPSFRWVLFGLVFVSILCVTGVSLYVFLPRADITVLVKDVSGTVDADVTARADQESVDREQKRIPLRFIEVEKDVTQSFPGTGKASSSDTRARGMITISNQFGSDPQSLVATTRFESLDGKIFRLAKGVTIPGTRQENGSSIPGTLEAEVIADDSGESYNIEPTSFTIPGFKGGPKFEKVTATSSKAFIGGGSGSGSVTASVSPDDVIRAKEEMEKKLSEMVQALLEKELRAEEKLLPGSFEFETLSSNAFPGVGAVASSFDYRVRVAVRALIFSEADAKDVIFPSIPETVGAKSVSLEYVIPRPDFATKSLLVRTKVTYSRGHELDIDRVKKELLGKSVDDVEGIFSVYPNIRKIEAVFWPKFMTNRIPTRASRVTIQIESVKE